jgi:3-methyladenine DNA glycosylase AlkD/uncharacterized protein YdhG (YjbR/CyaY superfamily)
MAAKTIDEYLAALSDEKRAALEELRKTIQAAAPQAEEGISYGAPAFRLDGRPLVAFSASANHCSFFPMNGTTVDALKGELAGYVTRKGTIRFTPAKPLPAALVHKVVKGRIAELSGVTPAQRPPKTARQKPVATDLAKERTPKPRGTEPGVANKPNRHSAKRAMPEEVDRILAKLRRIGTKATRDGMSRYGLPSRMAFGVPVGRIQQVAKELGKDHELAVALWETGWFEARMLAAFVDEPNHVTHAQMDRWCADFDNWGIVDTVCFHLFDRSQLAWRKIGPWSRRSGEFQRRAAFALLWSLSVHDKRARDELFLQGLELIEQTAADERNFVKKAINMALRAIGKRNTALNGAAIEVAQRLSVSEHAAARWVGKDALRELTSAPVAKRLGKQL